MLPWKIIQGECDMKNKESWWLLLILVVAAVLRISGIVLLPHQPVSDELAYLSIVKNFIEGQGLLDSMGNWAFYNVGYPIFVLIPLSYFFEDLLLAARCVNVMLGLGSVALCYLTAKEVGLGIFGRLSAAAMYAIYLPTGVYALYIAKENLLTFLMLLLVLCTIRIVLRVTLLNSVCVAIVVAAIALVGNSGLALLVSLGVGIWMSDTPVIKRIGASIGISALSVALIFPWLHRNEVMVGAPVLNTNGGFNFYLGNNPVADGYFMSIADTPAGDGWQIMRSNLGEYKASSALKEKAIEWIKSDPAQFFKLMFKKAVLFWWPPVHEGQGGGAVERIVRLAWLLQFVFLVGLCAISVFIVWPVGKGKILIFIMILAYTGVHMLFYVIYRYREPIMPLVAVCAAVTLDFIFRRYVRF